MLTKQELEKIDARLNRAIGIAAKHEGFKQGYFTLRLSVPRWAIAGETILFANLEFASEFTLEQIEALEIRAQKWLEKAVPNMTVFAGTKAWKLRSRGQANSVQNA